MYEDLTEIPDHLDFGLDILFCGINPGEQSSRTGHHYGNPTNHFWSCLHESGLTSRKLEPREDSSLPKSFRYGLTNLVSRPTVEQNDLSKSEQVSGVPILVERIRKYRPKIVCFVGLGIAEVFSSTCIPKNTSSTGKKNSSLSVGLQSYKIVYTGDQVVDSRQEDRVACSSSETATAVVETLFFAVSSTSGRVVRYQKTDKIRQFTNLKELLSLSKLCQVDTDQFICL